MRQLTLDLCSALRSLSPNTGLTLSCLHSFNPFAEMGVNPNDPNLAANLMNSPQAQAQMNALLSDPAMVDQIVRCRPLSLFVPF